MICAAMFCVFAANTIDGDTFSTQTPWGRQSFRLWGISAPERRDPAGPASTAALSALISGHVLACDIAGKPTWDRMVVRCTLPDGRDLGCEQIRAGQATEWLAFSRGYYEGCEPE